MKVPASIRRLHDEQLVANERLRKFVDERMRGIIDRRWHYESRIKDLQGFALKIESGRVADPAALEDFFACTLVVASASEIAVAERLVRESFSMKERRPRSSAETWKASNSFQFDDLRVYVCLPDSPATPPKDVAGILFEVQIKTFLQHAWTIATHDLVYKTDDANWSKERIAYQIKAMLEHAEVSILEAERLAASATLAMEDKATATIKRAIGLMKSHWGPDELPADVRRLASNVSRLSKDLSIDLARLDEVLSGGRAERGGAHPTNLSPYAIVVQYLFAAERDKMIELLSRERGRKVLVPVEVELPAGTDLASLPNALIV